MKKEYGVCFTSNDGKETHIVGHYMLRSSAEECAKKHRENGNLDVFIVERDVSEWKRSVQPEKPTTTLSWEERGMFGYAENWFDAHGYKWELKKEKRGTKIYDITSNGATTEVEISPDVTNPKKFMEFIDKLHMVDVQCYGAKNGVEN